jgi:extracellular elastinolytic metalloproteinase
MRRIFLLTILSLGLVAATAGAQDQPIAFDAERASVFKGTPGRPLTGPSSASGASVVTQFLQSHGMGAATAASLQIAAQDGVSRGGLTHIHMEQEIAGLRVAGAYVKASLDDRGRLIHVIQNVADVPAAGVLPARVDERQALRAALRSLYPVLAEDPAAVSVSRQGNVTTFEKTASFLTAPTVERVAIANKGGALKTGFEVETWTKKGNLLHYSLVGGDGRVLAVEARTNTDRYNIFPVHPDATAQTIAPGPGAGNDQSPAGWLAGPQLSVNISGNNAHAYLDTDANDKPDPGGSPVTNGDFLTDANLGVSPSTGDNREVAMQNLFYLNNVLHDTLYQHGFDEAAGNFQENNFGSGGKDSDSVNAEGQDGAGTDNANFATPHDGHNPRMQMFLWTGKGDHQVVVGATTYPAQGAVFGPPLDPTGVSGGIVLAHDGAGASDTDGCEAITTALAGSIALIDRGNCTFVVKVKNAQVAGAVGAIIANQLGDSIFTMGGADATITISSVFIGLTDGNALKASLPATGAIRLTDPPPLQRDGDVDSDVVYHEYGHGLTWRMIGRMSGPMSGAIGEGMSDTLAIILNENDVVGEYSFDDPLGIRTAPYHNFPRTYGSVTGSEVHFDGEVYGAIGWRLFEIFQGAGVSKDILLDYIVDGMNFTPAGPTFEDMRDGILQSVANSGSGDDCLVWQAFAQYGVGVGAKGVVHGSKVIVSESFALPSQCPAP